MAFINSGKGFDKELNHEKMKERMDNMDASSYRLLVPKEIYKKVKIKAAQEGITIRSILINALHEYLKC